MKFLKKPLMAAMVGVSALGLSVAAPSETQATSAVPIDVWALRDVVNQVQISPDGKHLLVHINPSREGDYLLQIYKTDDLSTPFRTLAADPMEIISARWVSDNMIVGNAWEQKRNRVRRQEDDTRNYATYFYNLERNKFSQVNEDLAIIKTLPDEPDKVLVAAAEPNGTLGVDPLQRFRPRSYYKLDLRSGSKSLVLRGSRKYARILFDEDGNPRYAEGQDSDNKVKTYYRLPGESGWTQFGPEYDEDDHENLYRFLSGIHGIAGFHHENPNIAYMIDNREGADKASLWEYDFSTGQYIRELFKSEQSDVLGVGMHSIPGNDKLAYAVYPGAKYERHWFDEEEKALHDALMQQIPYAHQLSISSRSYDGRTMIVSNSGPRDPGSFWLVKDGQLAKLGSRNPLLNQDALAEVKYIRYKARDGLEIPGYITVPQGEGPFPLVVQHNGGPHVNAVQGYSEIGQLFASAGYMVFYPQNRISTGWGQRHFDAGYGEHGLAMQDDKDDGVKYLIEQGLVDPDRVAFFGWSYGGYAALVALSREEQLYQCAIAVNGVSDPAKSFRLGGGRAGSSAPKALIDWAERRGTIGINPIKEVEKVNIPLLMIHGDVDRRVLYYHFTDYKKAFQDAGKQGEFVTLEKADHFGNTLMFNHQQQLYTKVLDYLANDCGPGGL
ncbi:alpha/beta hydrolase family protein [Qipengyuania nanhaisediminis]|uniref:alpha/beta hydrolase family protein n=1 Tax=Qipengyuania nanhaisediminis TaxID=604088 RepID=UPI0038B37546